MTFRKHLAGAAAALLAFGLFTLVTSSQGLAALVAAGIILAALTVLYFHYRRRNAIEIIKPVTPGRDDRVIPQDVRIAVAIRDKGVCQLQYPGICILNRELQYDHRYPWSKGGSSKDPDNIQLACKPCNKHKSDRVLV